MSGALQCECVSRGMTGGKAHPLCPVHGHLHDAAEYPQTPHDTEAPGDTGASGHSEHASVREGSNPRGSAPGLARAGAPIEKPLVCPYCGSELDFELTYTGHSYSEHRDLTGIECGSYRCLARWKPNGDVERPSKVSP